MKRQAAAEWRGDLKTGKGSLTTDSGVLSQTPYSFSTRFENEKGTNPEELIAAAHAGCFTMALSAELGKANLTAESLRTTAAVSLEKNGRRLGRDRVPPRARREGPGRARRRRSRLPRRPRRRIARSRSS